MWMTSSLHESWHKYSRAVMWGIGNLYSPFLLRSFKWNWMLRQLISFPSIFSCKYMHLWLENCPQLGLAIFPRFCAMVSLSCTLVFLFVCFFEFAISSFIQDHRNTFLNFRSLNLWLSITMFLFNHIMTRKHKHMTDYIIIDVKIFLRIHICSV